MTDTIPFTTFRGQLKQLETDFRYPVMGEYFARCFSGFTELDAFYADMKRQGIEGLVSAAGVQLNFGQRPRRFAGGPGLPPGRYFTVCDGSGGFHDGGTLRDEITAYYSEAASITPMIFDPQVEDWLIDFLQAENLARLTAEDLRHPFYYVTNRIERLSTDDARLRSLGEQVEVDRTISITYGLRHFPAEIDRIVDLREPDTQRWFVDTFVPLELRSEKAAARQTGFSFAPKRSIASFEDLLPVITSLETGGGAIFSQAIGHWLRRHGANGVIFPSARSNAFNRVRNGIPVDWRGWNLVVYAGAERPLDANLFGRMATWRDPDHDHIRVHYAEDGPERGFFQHPRDAGVQPA